MRFSKGGSPVNKNDLVALVADAAGLSKIDATKAVDAVFDGIIQSHGGFKFGRKHRSHALIEVVDGKDVQTIVRGGAGAN